jgi:hypothetical protein
MMSGSTRLMKFTRTSDHNLSREVTHGSGYSGIAPANRKQ